MTPAGAVPWLRQAKLGLDDRGFIAVHDTLETDCIPASLQLAISPALPVIRGLKPAFRGAAGPAAGGDRDAH